MVAPRPDIIERRACMSCVIESSSGIKRDACRFWTAIAKKKTAGDGSLVLHARRRRVRVRVDAVVPAPASVLVQEPGRLLEQRGRGRTPRHGRFEDVEAILVHEDLREGARAIRVGELQPPSL